MGAHLKEFWFLCGCLSLDRSASALTALREQLDGSQIVWERLIKLCDREMVTPTLYSCLRDNSLLDAVPESIHAVLRKRFQVNAIKNEHILDELQELLAALGAANIETIVLKGSAYLLETGPEHLGARMMRDLDLVVRPEKLDSTVKAFRAIGFRTYDEEDIGTFGYVPMYRQGTLAPIDLHLCIGEQKRVLPAAEAWAEAQPVAGAREGVYKLSPVHTLIHNVFHSEIQDRGYTFGFVRLRKLWDLARFCEIQGDQIDWGQVGSLTARFELSDVYMARLYQANQLLGLPFPDAMAPTSKAKSHLRRCLLMQQSAFLARVALFWAGATTPLKKHHLDLLYDCGLNPLTIGAFRVRHAFALIRKHHTHIWQKALQKRGQYE